MKPKTTTKTEKTQETGLFGKNALNAQYGEGSNFVQNYDWAAPAWGEQTTDYRSAMDNYARNAGGC